MTSQQLIEARAALWHHNAEPILTLDDAASWVAATGFLLFLPRRQQLRAPSPTFVEACMGKLEHTPARTDIENALSLAHRLFESGEAFPLNLLGTLSEEPDFLIARDRLPWLLSLRGDRSWKTAPGGRTSPLNISVWNLLDEQGELTAEEIRAGVGREVTEGAILRALVDLWGTLRVFPRYHDGETTWALAKTLCPRECTKGVTTSQGTALSFFLADYLRSAIAAAEDEIASFLSPLASRSRLREVQHALVATRQLLTTSLGPNTLYYVAGELPEFPEIAVPESDAEAAASFSGESGSMPEDGIPGEQEPHERIQKYTPRAESREPFQRRGRPAGDYRRSGSDRPAARSGFKPRSEGDFKPRREGEFKPRRAEGGYGRPSREGREDRPARREGGFRPREEGGFKPRREGGFRPREEGGFKPRREGGFKPRGESGFRPPFRKPRSESESGPPESNRPERTPRSAGEDRPPFRKSGFGDRGRKPFARKFQGDGERKSFGERKPYGDRKRPDFRSREDRPSNDRPYNDRPREERSGSRPDFRKERGGDNRPRRDSESSGRPPRKSFGKPGGFAKSSGKSFGKSSFKSSGKPSGASGKKTFGKGPGKPAGKSGFGKGPGKSFGKKFSKGPGKGLAKGSFRGAGKPRRRPE